MHDHSHERASSPEETLALLKYMLVHNRHHAEELGELAQGVDHGEARELLQEAVELLNASSDKLAAALQLWKGE